MKLSIDIDNRAEVEAAIPLLQLIHGHKFTTGASPSAPVHVTPLAAVIHPNDNPAAGLPVLSTLQPALPVSDAAAIFAGQPAQLPAGATPFVLPTGAPSTAGVPQSPNVPGAATGGLPTLPNGALPSAALTGLPGGAPMAGATGGNPASGVELDAGGIPWDERIHAGTKTKNADGRWKAKKGINDPALVARITAELQARVANAGAPNAAALGADAAKLAGMGMNPMTGQPLPSAAPFVPQGAPSQPAQTGAPLVPAGPPTTFEQFMARATPACLSGVMPMDAVQAAVIAHGLPSVTALQTQPGYIPNVWVYLQGLYPNLA